MRTKDAREAHADIGHFVSDYGEELIFEVLLKEFLIVHSLTAHSDEVLSPLESLCLEEVLLDNLHYALLLLGVVIELLQYVDETSTSSLTHLYDLIVAELKEHGQELLIHGLRVEKRREFA